MGSTSVLIVLNVKAVVATLNYEPSDGPSFQALHISNILILDCKYQRPTDRYKKYYLSVSVVIYLQI